MVSASRPEVEAALRSVPLEQRNGRVFSASGPLIRAKGNFSIGEICSITRRNNSDLLAEVVGFEGADAVLTPYGSNEGISYQSKISPAMSEFEVMVGDELTGRVLDALGTPIDDGSSLSLKSRYPGLASPPDPMKRPIISDPFTFGIKAIDGLLTCGVGQRMGVFAAAGGGKSTLLAMMAKYSTCDRIVIGLIGERGREVREFVQHSLGEAGMAKTTLVVATSDRPAVEQIKAAYTATTIAEYFRDQGQNVLLLVDSLTRFARAQRQIGLSAGEPPTRRGYPPSVFEKLPGLLERGGLTNSGAITALYTILVEGDDLNEPVSDEARSLLDGHIVLSRKLAERGHYPAIDVAASASRVMRQIVSQAHIDTAQRFKMLISKYEEIELLLQMGEYEKGADREADDAVRMHAGLQDFLKQGSDEPIAFSDSVARMMGLVHGG